MRTTTIRFAALCGIAVSSFATSAAPSEVLLAMPFACHLDRGEVRLTPGPIQTFQIYGIPEGRAFSSCSPRNPGICRSWMLHRFDLNCGGVRVSWLSVVRALTTNWMPNRSWVSEGRLHIRTGPRWSSVGPCFMRPPLGYGWRDRGPVFYWPCARATGQVINRPSGFAPMFSSFAHFEPQAQPRQADLQYEGDASEPVGRSAPAINKSVLAERPSKEVPRSQSGEISEARHLKVDPGQDLQGKNREVVEIDGPSAADPTPVGSVRAYKVSADELWFALTVMVLISGIWLLWRRVEPTKAAIVTPREATARASRRFPGDPQRPRPSVSSTSSSLEHSILEDNNRLPSTRNEALQVLGATAETGEDVLKEIVRALRQKWHPDRARAEERPFWERRLKQINVAWDILRGKQAARA
jgi:hypothetical protein